MISGARCIYFLLLRWWSNVFMDASSWILSVEFWIWVELLRICFGLCHSWIIHPRTHPSSIQYKCIDHPSIHHPPIHPCASRLRSIPKTAGRPGRPTGHPWGNSMQALLVVPILYALMFGIGFHCMKFLNRVCTHLYRNHTKSNIKPSQNWFNENSMIDDISWTWRRLIPE